MGVGSGTQNRRTSHISVLNELGHKSFRKRQLDEEEDIAVYMEIKVSSIRLGENDREA